MGFYNELNAFGNADRKKYKNLAVADLLNIPNNDYSLHRASRLNQDGGMRAVVSSTFSEFQVIMRAIGNPVSYGNSLGNEYNLGFCLLILV